jgi:hypothetical protein
MVPEDPEAPAQARHGTVPASPGQKAGILPDGSQHPDDPGLHRWNDNLLFGVMIRRSCRTHHSIADQRVLSPGKIHPLAVSRQDWHHQKSVHPARVKIQSGDGAWSCAFGTPWKERNTELEKLTRFDSGYIDSYDHFALRADSGYRRVDAHFP